MFCRTKVSTLTVRSRESLFAISVMLTGRPPPSALAAEVPDTNPAELEIWLREVCRGVIDEAIVAGTLDRRLALVRRVDDGGWWAADLCGWPHATRSWPSWIEKRLAIHNPNAWWSPVTIAAEGLHRLTGPRVLLVALYHPEFFPLPRFPLAISDLARAVRATLMGRVTLMDMQLGVTLDDVIGAVRHHPPDILGISATFGQHDLMIRVLDAVEALSSQPLVLAGGSLTARNERFLIDRYPFLIVARGAGERTMQDAVLHWHGDLTLAQIHGIGYQKREVHCGEPLRIGSYRHNASLRNGRLNDILPELDLLDQTFTYHGVAQLETSRGCTNYCSFCPRGHKGTWSGADSSALPWILREIRNVFDRHPDLSRTIYLVDEEFIGREANAIERALAVAQTLHSEGFQWETSCRIDQVVRCDRDRAWHVARAKLWRELVRRGLHRCLFGVESGVTSILRRFQKETIGEQNALAIRTLSALGVPTRFTYITFDHLMSPTELRQTFEFQGRCDLLLHDLVELSVEEIVDGVHDPEFVARHAVGQPLYSSISYPLVSMECLMGAAYTKRVEAAGLARGLDPSMGRVIAEFADWRIGRCSHHAQLWIDRNFALDYTLKSMEKFLDGQLQTAIRSARLVIRTAAFQVLGYMVRLLDQHPMEDPDRLAFDGRLLIMLDAQLIALRDAMSVAMPELDAVLPEPAQQILRREHARWQAPRRWGLINAADPCGT